MEDVTAKVAAATAGKNDQAANDARKAELTKLESALRGREQAQVPGRHAV